MGKKGSWFSVVKRVFTFSCKGKSVHGPKKKKAKERKKGHGILRHGEIKSFIPFFKEPSTIEKILGEVDEQKLLVRPHAAEQSGIPSALTVRPTSPRVDSPRAASARTSSDNVTSTATSPRIASPRASSHKITSPRAASPRIISPRAGSSSLSSPRAPSPKAIRNHEEISYAKRSEPTLGTLHLSATKMQAAYRGYMVRRSFRSLKGLVRLQGVLKSSYVKRQTLNASKQMQLLVRVQAQIQSRKFLMLENQALQHQAYRHDKEVESTLSKWTQLTEAGDHEDWDNSALTKEEVEARKWKKVEATIKRERAMVYASSHQLRKVNSKSALDIRATAFPWWWKWLESHLSLRNASENESAVKNVHPTTPKAISEHMTSPQLLINSFRRFQLDSDSHESTPRSTKSAFPMRSKPMHTPSRTPPMSRLSLSRPRASAASSPFNPSLKDDNSLTSCPPFSVPNYMSPTISAKAKFRPKSKSEERNTRTPSNYSKRRLSFPLTPNSGSSKLNKRSGMDATSLSETEKQEAMGDHMSVDSTVSMPAVVGRKEFNRFV